MKNFDNPKELSMKLLEIDSELNTYFDDYIKREQVTLDNYEHKLFDRLNLLCVEVFDQLIETDSVAMRYVLDNMENETGDAQLIAAFIRVLITNRIYEEISAFDDMKEEAKKK